MMLVQQGAFALGNFLEIETPARLSDVCLRFIMFSKRGQAASGG